MSRLRIKSDGTTHGTHIYDEDGKEIHGIALVKITMDANKGKITAELFAHDMQLDLEEVIKV